MTQPVVADPASPHQVKVSAQDASRLGTRHWIGVSIRVCALGLLTVLLLACSTELLARLLFPALKSTAAGPTGVGEDCLVLHDKTAGVRGIPNCVVWEKPLEGELSDYRFNSSGYRNDTNFAPKRPGTYRIVVLGTSMATGLRVPQARTFSALLPAELSQKTGRNVELYNLGLPWRSPAAIAQHMDETLALQPDLVLWVLTPKDVWGTSWEPPVYEAPGHHARARLWPRLKAALAPKALTTRLSYAASQLRTVTMLRHLLYASPSLYVPSSIAGADYDRDFLDTKTSAKWQNQLDDFNRSADSIQAQSTKAGVPLAAVLIPDRTQLALIAMMQDRPADLDPYKLDNELRSIIASHGGTYIDILPGFRALPNPQQDYMAVDGHPNAHAHAEIASFLASQLAPLVSTQPRADSEPGH